MNLKRTLLRPIAALASMKTQRSLAAFLRAHRHTRRVQDRLLGELLRSHRQTAFARDHALHRVRNYHDFTQAVPIRTYEELRPYMDRVLAGETTALLPPGQEVLMFSMTSGTTGRPKHIPVTPAFAAQMKRTFTLFGYKAICDHREVWLRPILTISSPMRETDSPTGLPCGAISGLLRDQQLKIVQRMYVVPPAVTAIAEPTAKYYTTLRCSIDKDVSFIATANPSSTIRLIDTGRRHAERLIRDVADGTLNPPGTSTSPAVHGLRFRPNRSLARRLEDGIARDGTLLPSHFWNVAFLANWTGGTVGLYLPRLRQMFRGVPIRDIGLLASEGRFTIPLADELPAGVAEITSNFLEFIPAEDYEKPSPPARRAHQVDVGGEYFLVVTNSAGLWRYSLDDRVRVVDRLGDSPVLEFLCRGLHTANITGEKITEQQVVEAMRHAAQALSVHIDRFVVQGRFAQTPYYELRFEPFDGADPHRLGAAFDEALKALNIEYAAKRKSGRLGAARTALLPAGALEQAEQEYIRRRGRTEQYKHQYLLTDVIEA